jgi:hypothetical protein
MTGSGRSSSFREAACVSESSCYSCRTYGGVTGGLSVPEYFLLCAVWLWRDVRDRGEGRHTVMFVVLVWYIGVERVYKDLA